MDRHHPDHLRNCPWALGGPALRRRYRLAFECFRCGKCCSHLGYVHTIGEEYGEYGFLVRNNYTGEECPVVIDPDKHALFDDKSIFTKLPHACPFFRHLPGSEESCCTVHETRPEICRDYECWRLLILDHTGRRAGHIEYLRTLCSDDLLLKNLWEQCIEGYNEPDDRRWEDGMIRVLGRAGYRVRK